MNTSKATLEIIDSKTDLSKLQLDRKPLNQSNISSKSSDELILVKASDIIARPIDWLWKWFIALGKIHLIGGIAKTGKTTIALELASRITNGGLFPDGQRAKIGEVVMWTGEDDLADTLKPRLMAMNANCEKIHFIKGYNDGKNVNPFNPANDMAELEATLENRKDVKLLIIDPLVSITKGNSHNNAETRKDLTPLHELAERLHIAVIGITHFTKNTAGQEPIERITGSLAWSAVPRVVFMTTKTKDDDGNDTCIFLRAESNISPKGGGFYYSLVKDEVSTETLEKIETSKVEWGDWKEGEARDLLAQAEKEFRGGESPKVGKLESCEDWIADILSNGEMNSDDFFEEAKEAGFSLSTFRRAKDNLKVVTERKGGIADKGYWVCYLPKVLNNS